MTLRQYDMMREAENSFIPQEEWPSRWRLRQLRKHMLKSAIPLRRETTTRQLPVGKGRALRKLPDAVVSYIPFSEHGKSGSLIMRLEEARGPGSFDIHEHVVVAPSHLLYYNIGSNLLMESYDALSVEQRDSFTKQMRRCAKYVPTHTVLSSFEHEKMGGTTLSMSDYAVLLTVGPTVLQYSVHPPATSPHAVAALGALHALRRFSTALFYLPTSASDGEEAVRTRPTVAELQVLGESLMIELRRLLPFNGSWERPSVHRLLELLYRTLPLVQLGPAICELIFERFHQLAKREVSQSNSWNPAEYAIQRWRDT